MKNKIIPKLSEILKDIGPEMGLGHGEVIFSAINVDDVFGILYKRRLKEVIVSREEMFQITRFMIANSMPQLPDYKPLSLSELNWLIWEALSEGKVNKFFGVRLILEKE